MKSPVSSSSPMAPGDVVLEQYAMRIRAVRFLAHIGASRSERAVPQEILVDVELTLPVSALPARDHVRDVVSYDTVATGVVEEGQAQPHRLLETYVARVVARLLAETPATRVRVAATKTRVPTKYPVEAAVVEIVGSRRTEPSSG